MFTGIITDLGRVRKINWAGDACFTFETSYNTEDIKIGSSIACNGACMTVIATGSDCFSVSVSAESLSKTTMSNWRKGMPVNFERALKVGDELGGHIVSGHVDGVGHVVSMTPEGESKRFVFKAPHALKNFIAPKGSIAIDGVSLTVNEVDHECFGINIIPHTWNVTTFGKLKIGSSVNLEIDMLARYVARLLEKDRL